MLTRLVQEKPCTRGLWAPAPIVTRTHARTHEVSGSLPDGMEDSQKRWSGLHCPCVRSHLSQAVHVTTSTSSRTLSTLAKMLSGVKDFFLFLKRLRGSHRFLWPLLYKCKCIKANRAAARRSLHLNNNVNICISRICWVFCLFILRIVTFTLCIRSWWNLAFCLNLL